MALRMPAVYAMSSSPGVRSFVVTIAAAVAAFVLIGTGTPAAQQAPQTGAAPVVRPSVTALPVAQAPTLDGDVLADPVWQAAVPATAFRQEQPEEGQPSSERTDIRIVYTADTLYIGVVCFDRDPKSIIVSDARRDAPLDQTDSVQIILDTYRDRLNGFVFGTNPAGIEYDGQVTNEGQGGGGLGLGQTQQSGSGSGFNLNWDGVWDVRTRISDIGWSAEFAIPFRTLRYPGGVNQTWGVNFQRNIRRRNERSYWAPISRQYNLYRLSLAGSLLGIKTPALRNLKATPYVLGNVKQSGERPVDAALLGQAGGDAKYNLTPSLTLDATVNTDFAQVEVDDQQVNLDRFNLFFPEKRPFFLENAGFFSVGNPGEVDLFFSRQIGIRPDTGPIPIAGGARVSGKAGKFNVGLLNMQTRRVQDRIAANNFSVARVSRDLPNRSSIGALFVNREGTGSLARAGDSNRTFALDGKAAVRQYTVISSFVAKTVTPGVHGDDHAFNVRSRTSVPRFDLDLGYQEVGSRFNPEAGFLSRKGYRKPDVRFLTRWRPAGRIIQELRPHTQYRAFVGFDGLLESSLWHIDNHWQFRNSAEAHTGINLTQEGVRVPFEIYPKIFVPAGTYKHEEAQLVFFTNQGAHASVDVRTIAGGYFGGRRFQFNPTLRVRVGNTLTTELVYQRNDITLPWGAFTTNLLRGRLSYAFTTHAFVQGLVQYNDRADLWSANLRLGWLRSGNTGLFLVYTDTRALDELFVRPARTDRSFILKFSRTFDLLR
jgi:hypothetical protein